MPSEESTDETYRGECPYCENETTFSEGGRFGTLSCDSCGYTPRKKTRDEIRSVGTETQQGGER
jgi:tRNA(Ile2) C34 agmatinyltransferase TiaS